MFHDTTPTDLQRPLNTAFILCKIYSTLPALKNMYKICMYIFNSKTVTSLNRRYLLLITFSVCPYIFLPLITGSLSVTALWRYILWSTVVPFVPFHKFSGDVYVVGVGPRISELRACMYSKILQILGLFMVR